jgi:hypothetical protein
MLETEQTPLGKKIIIGVHGLDNKPELRILRDWWKSAIDEGIARNCLGRKPKIRFKLVYWSDLMYAAPLGVAEVSEPYVAAEGSGPLPRFGLSARKVAAARVRGSVGKVFEKVSNTRRGEEVIREALKSRMPDLYRYKHQPGLREAVQARLIKRLRVARRWRREVMLIAHSMGSIIAYEVLRDAGRTLPKLEISHFVTLGSPLGLSDFKEVVEGQLHVPECVGRWSSFADPRDPVARWDAFLSKDYEANQSGVTIADNLVLNGYVSPSGKANAHKIYGYLRTPEISELIDSFAR